MSSMLSGLPRSLRRAVLALWVSLVGGTLFIALPETAGWLNERMQWPVFVIPGGQVSGYALLAFAVALFLYCSRAFVALGKGTIVPIDAPPQLVRSGIYRFSRNPIYIAYLGILFADFLRNGELARLLYLLLFFTLLQIVIVYLEEPGLSQRFGLDWDTYKRRVPRWLPLNPRYFAKKDQAPIPV